MTWIHIFLRAITGFLFLLFAAMALGSLISKIIETESVKWFPRFIFFSIAAVFFLSTEIWMFS